MRAFPAGDIELEFQFIESSLQVFGGNGSNHGVALVTDQIRLVPAHNRKNAAARIGIAQLAMRNYRDACRVVPLIVEPVHAILFPSLYRKLPSQPAILGFEFRHEFQQLPLLVTQED
jgi:hypothetical protein